MEDKCVKMENETIDYYEMHVDEYMESTINADVSKLYAIFEENIPTGCKIMDLGCAGGRDSKYFVDKGYKVLAVDPSPAMCKKAGAYAKVSTLVSKAENLEFEEEFDAIWACASLLHIPRQHQKEVLLVIARSLKLDGIAYCSWKYGEKDRIENGRCFIDLNEIELKAILSNVPDLKLIKCWVTNDVRSNNSRQKWLNVLIKKELQF